MTPKGWKKVSLGEIASVTSGGTPRKSEKSYWDGDVPWVRTTEVQNCEIFASDVCYKITQAGLRGSSAKLLPKDSLLMAMIGQGKTRGQVAILRVEAATNQNCAAIIFKGGCVPDFYYQYFLSQYEVIRSFSNSAGQSNLSASLVKSLSVPLPSIDEQNKIARILFVWDEAVSTTEHLIEASQQQRNALSQQLLTGTRRLPGFAVHAGWRHEKYGDVPNDWGFVEIGSFSRQSSGKNRETEELPVLSCSKYDGFVDSLSYFNKRVYSEDLSGYKVIYRGDIGFPSNHVEEGSIGLQNLYDRGLVSPIYVVFRPDEERVDPEFLFRLLKTDHYRQVFAASTNASVDRRGSLRWKEFSAIKVPLPSLDEQKAIVLALKTADAEIEAQQQRLDCLRQEKRALMQQLLTGKRRVKVEATAPTEEAAC